MNDLDPPRAIRLWPGVAAVSLQWLLLIGVPVAVPEASVAGVLAGVVGGLVVFVWWLAFSRVPWWERIGAMVLIAAAVAATPRILHPSIATGMMGMMFPIYSIPVLSLALVGWAAFTHRRAALVAAILAACGVFALLRTEGITGGGRPQLTWRWSPTPEQQLLAATIGEPRTTAVPPVSGPSPAAAEWPGFRGPRRDSVITGLRIRTDWAVSPPRELWRKPVGPGWSSFAEGGGLLYTQEQRGETEVVSCYQAATGEPVWSHGDPARFWESNGGAGPRATPTLVDRYVYTFGATGILNSLDAKTGAVVWTRNAASDTGAKLPGWGFAGSPLVLDDLVIVAAAGRLAAYDRASGKPRWVKTEGGGSYSSPHLLNIGGVPQVALLNSSGVISLAPEDGKVLWQHAWPGTTILQPASLPDGGMLIATGDMSGGMGLRRLAVTRDAGRWKSEEVWTSTGLKPYFNDFVVHNGHAFGFDGGILACIDLQDGKRKWKGGRYGHGQMLLLADQNVLLVLAEEGELALVEAVAGQFNELARFRAMDDKTWNHPVLAGGMLFVRNGREMVAFRLARAGS
jgi:outer membrane protein assembly factor BamB